MSNYAIIELNKVSNIVVADSALSGNWVCLDGLDPHPGIGWDYENGVFSAPVVPVVPVVTPKWEWYIDLGPFFDRFGATKMQILMSQDATVKAILADIYVRKWIDLKNPEVSSSLQYISTVIPSVTQDLINTILTTPVTEEENMALRKNYF